MRNIFRKSLHRSLKKRIHKKTIVRQMTDKTIKQAIDNSIRSLFQMIAVVTDSTGECKVIDHNMELMNITADNDGKNHLFSDLCAKIMKNVHPVDREAFAQFSDHDQYVGILRSRVYSSMECRIRHSDRKYHWSEIIICNTAVEDSTKGDDCLFMIRDIDDRKRRQLKREAEERAVLKSLQSRYDALFEENMTDQQTGCYNRKGLKYYSDIVIDEAKSNNRKLFVCVCDLNGLKHLNDTYGHAAGDEAIAAVSKELIKAAPAGARTIRTGGDEFLIFAAVDDSKEPEEFGEKVDKGLKDYNDSHSNPYTIGASYGWVLLEPKENMTSLDEYVEMADAKMYEMRVKRDKYRRN